MKPIIMLTYNDRTVDDVLDIFKSCKSSKAKYFGIKNGSLDLYQMKLLFDDMRKYNKVPVYEIISYEEKECLENVKMVKECGGDIVIGTCFYDSVNDFCKNAGIKYMPFLGKVKGVPSILEGEIEGIVEQAKEYYDKGVFGFNLLAYRYEGNAEELMVKVIKEVNIPVIIAGSIDCYKKIDFIKTIKPFGLTVGSALFQNKFGNNLVEQIDNICDYLER